ncbi:hypothetical protein C8Q79DRAFT_1091195 [Trametes meyenii]|nr:hypothetical protein C8Q79DRAFT_1091195 [Trametes meyenii]
MPPRKKAKTASSKKAVEQTLDDNRATSSSNATPPSEPVAEQVVVVKPFRNVRGRRGGLADMPKMPIDILLEIMALLHPRDLLNLARTTKEFRAFLMSRNSASLWKAARKQVPGLPDLPYWLSEPAYANLMFFTYCHGCLKPNIQSVYWRLCARYCNDECPGAKLIRPTYCLPAAFKQACTNLLELDKTLNLDLFLQYQLVPSNRCCRQYVVCAQSEVDEFCREWKELKSDADKLRFAKERQERAQERKNITSTLEIWARGRRQDRREELQALRCERFAAIKTRLRQEGWGADYDFMNSSDHYAFSRLTSVNKAAKLTDKAWNNIRDDMSKFMQTVRNRRLQHERRQRFIARLQMLHKAFNEHLTGLGHGARPRTIADELLPLLGDFAVMPQFRELVMAESSEDTVTVEMFASIFQESWDDLVAAWREDRKAKFLENARRGLSGTAAADADEPLDLAITTFSCQLRCSSSSSGTCMRWPEVLAHPCLRPISAPHDMHSEVDADLWFALERVCGRREIMRGDTSSNVVAFNLRLSTMRVVISACGQDPDTVSWDAMQACPVRLTCQICAQARPDRRQVFDWLAAVTHHHFVHYRRADPIETGTQWEIVDEEYAARARALESALLLNEQSGPTAYGWGRWYACAWCSKEPLRNASDMAWHVRIGHEKPTAVNGVDMYFVEDVTRRAYSGMPPVWMFSEALAENEEVKSSVETGKGFFVSFLPGPSLPETSYLSEESDATSAASD